MTTFARGAAKAFVAGAVAGLAIVAHSLSDGSWGWGVVVEALITALVAFQGVYWTTNTPAPAVPS